MTVSDRRDQIRQPTILRVLRWLFRPETMIVILLASLLGLPFVMMRAMSQATLAQMTQQASEISLLASNIRSYYADNVIGRLQASDGKAIFSENYRDVHGGIPIPATLSIELGAMFDSAHTDGRISYRFVSDYPFLNRKVPPLDAFEIKALDTLRGNPELAQYSQFDAQPFGRQSYRLATPVIMRQACVTCHNTHPDSQKRDWKVGDIRGIQSVSVRGMDVEGFSELNNIFIYSGIVGLASIGSAFAFQSQSSQLRRINARLRDSNEREASLTERLSSQLDELTLLGSVVDKATFGVSIADMRKKDCPLIYVNEAFVSITGYPKDKSAGFNCRFLRGPETDPEATKAIATALRNGESLTCELINYRMDGTKFWNRLTLYPIFGSDGKPDFYVGNQVDITALKEVASNVATAYADFKLNAEQSLISIEDALKFSRGLEEKLASRQILTDDQILFFRSERESLELLRKRLRSIVASMSSNARLQPQSMVSDSGSRAEEQ